MKRLSLVLAMAVAIVIVGLAIRPQVAEAKIHVVTFCGETYWAWTGPDGNVRTWVKVDAEMASAEKKARSQKRPTAPKKPWNGSVKKAAAQAVRVEQNASAPKIERRIQKANNVNASNLKGTDYQKQTNIHQSSENKSAETTEYYIFDNRSIKQIENYSDRVVRECGPKHMEIINGETGHFIQVPKIQAIRVNYRGESPVSYSRESIIPTKELIKFTASRMREKNPLSERSNQ